MNKMSFRIKHYDEIDSTNKELKMLAANGEEEGLVLVADKQTEGRGRLGRAFHSPEGGLYFSFLLRPCLDLSLVNHITLLCAVCMVRTVKILFDLEVSVKWVNDILYQDKKLCGILTESVIGKGEQSKFVIVGIGLNLSSTESFPNEIREIVTSLVDILKIEIDKNKILEVFLSEFCQLYETLIETKNSECILNEYRNYLSIINREVLVLQGGNSYKAKVLSLTQNGGLLVENKNHEEIELISGEVSLKIGT